jgi:hypothetical protein
MPAANFIKYIFILECYGNKSGIMVGDERNLQKIADRICSFYYFVVGEKLSPVTWKKSGTQFSTPLRGVLFNAA